ncbi:hypothetical protein EVAR_103435_1 [Eumeta japonica]|uniref:Uncharacterized protein n=1 Tax=Eumeta variegata TaxID=151549 RepID=A0A4C1SXF4_EUMVA|nr:hypothetical protein EVAR_103435_1 [Eumeta japonica]
MCQPCDVEGRVSRHVYLASSRSAVSLALALGRNTVSQLRAKRVCVGLPRTFSTSWPLDDAGHALTQRDVQGQYHILRKSHYQTLPV